MLSSFTNKIGQIFPSATENFTSHSNHLYFNLLSLTALITYDWAYSKIRHCRFHTILYNYCYSREKRRYILCNEFKFYCTSVYLYICKILCMSAFAYLMLWKWRDSPFVVILSILFSVVSKELFSSFSAFINFFLVVFWNINTSRSVQSLTSIISFSKENLFLQLFSMKDNFVDKEFHLNWTNALIMTTVHVNQIRKEFQLTDISLL